MTILKKPFIGILILLAIVIIVAASLLIIGKTQRTHDINTLHDFVNSKSELEILRQKQSVQDTIACSANSKEYGKCPAIAYNIDMKDCLLLMMSFHIQNQTCNQTIAITYQDRSILIHFGATYGHSGLYATIEMNESNLLWQRW